MGKNLETRDVSTHRYRCLNCKDLRVFVACRPVPPICERPVQRFEQKPLSHGGHETHLVAYRCGGEMVLL